MRISLLFFSFITFILTGILLFPDYSESWDFSRYESYFTSYNNNEDSDSDSFRKETTVNGCIDELDDQNINWATGVFNAEQGLRINGTPVLPSRSIPENALGAPDIDLNDPDNLANLIFWGPGLDLAPPDQTEGGFIELTFIQKFCDGPGVDIIIQEVTFARNSYRTEEAIVEVCKIAGDPSSCSVVDLIDNEVPVLDQFDDGRIGVDINGVLGNDCAESVKITDFTDKSLFIGFDEGNCGYDIDAVGVCNLKQVSMCDTSDSDSDKSNCNNDADSDN